MQFVIPGIIVQTVVFGTVMTGIGLSEDPAKGIIDRFRSLPIARSAVLTGRILADSARTTAAILVTAEVGMLLGFRLAGGSVAALGAFALAIGFGTAFAWIAATIGLTVRNPETAQSAGFLWMFPLTFASAAFAPAASMPGWLQPFVEANPITGPHRRAARAHRWRAGGRPGAHEHRLDPRPDRGVRALGHPPVPPPA